MILHSKLTDAPQERQQQEAKQHQIRQQFSGPGFSSSSSMSTGRPLQQQQNNVRVIKRQGSLNRISSSPLKNSDKQQQQQDDGEVTTTITTTMTTLVKRPSPILKKVSSFDCVDDHCRSSNGGLDYQSPLTKDGLIMDPPTPLFFSFTYGMYSETGGQSMNGNYVNLDEELSSSSSCGSSTVDDPSPPPRKIAVLVDSKKKKKVTFAVPESVTFTEKEPVVPSPRLLSIQSTSSSSRNITNGSSSSSVWLQPNWKRQTSPKSGRIAPESFADLTGDPCTKKRCSWITTTSDAAYVEYHDSEWGVPVHDDKILFELLVFAGAQAELSWSAILSKREHYRAAFAGFDAEIVSKFDSEKLLSLAADPEILQHEGKLRQIVDNAKCIVEVVQEFGSLDKFMWNFLSQKPIVNRYKTPQQVPIKSAKSDYMSRELMKRGFRFVGPTIMYSFMQAAGMTNDHIVHCFRHEECIGLSNSCSEAVVVLNPESSNDGGGDQADKLQNSL